MKPLEFWGPVPSSKSEVARALIIASHLEGGIEKIQYHSRAQDVTHARKCLLAFSKAEREFDCGDSATLFRFLALRVSRVAGHFRLTGSVALLARPHEELLQIFSQLGIRAYWSSNFSGQKTALNIESSQGWVKPPNDLIISVDRSSQFASAVALNVWNLDFNLKMKWVGKMVSQSYFDLTLGAIQKAGALVRSIGPNAVEVAANHPPQFRSQMIEGDWSSAFFVFALATVSGKAQVENLNIESAQADRIGLQILQKMGVQINCSGSEIEVFKTLNLKSINVDLTQAPDLFPVLACLCATANGVSTLSGLAHLEFKESHRLKRIAELLTQAGVHITASQVALKIHGPTAFTQKLEFDPRPDHRLAMGAILLKAAGAPIEILHPETISKSFPEFLNVYQELIS